MKCENCMFSKIRTDENLEMKRFCHFDHPKIHLLLSPRGPIMLTAWPEVKDDDFCSYFLEKEHGQNVPEGPVPGIIVS